MNFVHLMMIVMGVVSGAWVAIFSKSIFGRCRGQCQGSGMQRWSCFQVLLWIKNIRFEFKVEQIVGASHCNTWQPYLDTPKHSWDRRWIAIWSCDGLWTDSWSISLERSSMHVSGVDLLILAYGDTPCLKGTFIIFSWLNSCYLCP